MVLIGTIQNCAENFFHLLKVVDLKENILYPFINRLDLESEGISDIYKSQWTIELFLE